MTKKSSKSLNLTSRNQANVEHFCSKKNDKLLLFYFLLILSTSIPPPSLCQPMKRLIWKGKRRKVAERGVGLYKVLGFETFRTCLRRKVAETRRQMGWGERKSLRFAVRLLREREDGGEEAAEGTQKKRSPINRKRQREQQSMALRIRWLTI